MSEPTGSVRADLASRVAVASQICSQLVLTPPTPELAALFSDPDAPGQWPLKDAAAEAALREAVAGEPATAEELRDDHFRLFVGPGRGLACPYESVYVSRDGLLFGDETFDVRATYARAGLSADPSEPDDHLGVELAFVAELAGRIAAHDERHLCAELGGFLAQHLDRFAPQVLAEVGEHARTPIYRTLPALTRSVLVAAQELAASQWELADESR